MPITACDGLRLVISVTPKSEGKAGPTCDVLFQAAQNTMGQEF